MMFQFSKCVEITITIKNALSILFCMKVSNAIYRY